MNVVIVEIKTSYIVLRESCRLDVTVRKPQPSLPPYLLYTTFKPLNWTKQG